jgi:hypothetical protein
MIPNRLSSFISVAVFCACTSAFGQAAHDAIQPKGPARPPNSDGAYQTERHDSPSGEGVQVKDFTLERQGGRFHLNQGNVFFYSPVNGRVTGAVFIGSGHFDLAVENASERHSLALLSKGGVLSQDFSTLVLRFTDDTAAEIRKASAGSAGQTPNQAVSDATDLAQSFRTRLHDNLDIRLLSDEMMPLSDPGAQYFLASFRMGGTFTGRNVLFVVDPQSIPDQVKLDTWSTNDMQTWAGYRMNKRIQDEGAPTHIVAENLDVRFENSGTMHASAETSVGVLRDGLRVIRLNLYPTLRVTSVFDETGLPLDFIQEDKHDDPEFAVILAAAARRGSKLRLLIQYGGPDAVRKDGDGMYYLLESARENWYPGGVNGLGDFANFHMTFHLPKNLQIVATGKEISKDKENGGTRVVWDSGEPIAVAGFNLGTFQEAETKTPQGFGVEGYANTEVPDSVKGLLVALSSYRGAPGRQGSSGDAVPGRQGPGVALGNMSTVGALKGEIAQGSAAIQVYTDFFGKLPYDHVALTEQSACNFGQSWPMLVYLPICAFWDSTIQQQLGLLRYDRSYWQEVTPHEVSHQWWGQLVGFDNYRDQWMSEGFANFSVSLYLAATNKTLAEYRDFWAEQHKNLVEKNYLGFRPIDVGPLTMGGRVSNEKTGNVYQSLIYSKGAYVMHMLQIMYWTPQLGDAPFKQTMQAFVKQYSGKSASTEDLKASFEATMPKSIDLTHNGKLDWFFNEYVYGTELPHYDISSEFTVADGETSVHFKLTQANVSKDFQMIVPIYLQLADGRTAREFNLVMVGDMSSDHTVKLGKLPAAAQKMVINYNADVLSE